MVLQHEPPIHKSHTKHVLQVLMREKLHLHSVCSHMSTAVVSPSSSVMTPAKLWLAKNEHNCKKHEAKLKHTGLTNSCASKHKSIPEAMWTGGTQRAASHRRSFEPPHTIKHMTQQCLQNVQQSMKPPSFADCAAPRASQETSHIEEAR